MKEDQKNFLIFAVVAAIILFGSQYLMGWLMPPANPPVTKIEGGKTKVVPNPGADPAADSPAAIRDRAVVLRETPRVLIDTPLLKGSINLKGARIDDLVLKPYKQTVDKGSPPIRLLSPAGAPGAYFAGFSWRDTGLKLPTPDTVWQASSTQVSVGRPVTLQADNGQGQRFRIEIAVDDAYMFTVKQSVLNASGQAVQAAPYGYVNRTGRSTDIDQWVSHVGPVGVFGNGANYDIGYENLEGDDPGFFAKMFGTTAKAGANYFDTKGGWAGFGDHYWLTALIPDQNASVRSGFQPGQRGTFQADVAQAPITVPAGRVVTTTMHFFVGAKEVTRLDDYEDKLGIPHFGKAIDWGWFEIIEKPIFYYLDWLFRAVGNFGLAIILLTFTIRLLLFPIAQRQFASMAGMRALQPKMKALQERYKDDKPRQQQEIMKLYKDEKVNPLAGCAPTLLQIPIMFALYKVLVLTIEMRHQPFILWIRDLSAPDPLTPINLFGLLPFTPPAFIAIGVIPILLGVSMWAQFKLNPAPLDEMQKQVFAIMPWMLMFVMAPFAVGLQVYWITSNLLTIAQQWWLYRQHPALKVAPAK